MRTKAFSPPSYYLQQVLPKMLELGAVRIAPFSNRLAHSVPSDVQKLRCLANYEALRFPESIRILADNMVGRMIKRSSLTGGKYVSVHLRFEELSHAAHMKVVLRRIMQWKMLVKGAGEASFTDLVE